MLVCNVSLRPPRSAIAATIAETAVALDNLGSGSGQVVFATLVDDPASVGEIVDAFLGEVMLEAASADAVADGSVPAVYSAAVNETATATDTPSWIAAAFTPASLTGLIGWWDASVTASLSLTGSSVNSVADQSGAGNTAVWGAFVKPIYNATGFNSKPAFMYDTTLGPGLKVTPFPMGTGNTLTCWYVGNMTGSTYFLAGDARALSYAAPSHNDYDFTGSWALYRPASGNTLMRFMRNNISRDGSAAHPGNHRVICTIDSSGVITMYVDGVSAGTATQSGSWVSAGVLSIGCYIAANANIWDGSLAEFGVATGWHDTTTVSQLDTYLKTKWGL